MPRLIVTGATGFIGRPAADLAVARGFVVDALCTRVPHQPHPRVTYHTVDLLRDRERLRVLIRDLRPSHCLHLAWDARPGIFWCSRDNYQWVAATLDLADAFADAGGVRLVAAGTCAEYAWDQGICLEDETPLEPVTPYGVAKDATRRLLESWSRVAGVSFAWGRVFFSYGPGEHPDRLVSSVARALLRGETARCTDGLQRRDFLHVGDIADAFVTLLTADHRGPLNIASGNGVEVREVVTLLAREIGRPDLLALGARPPSTEPMSIVGDTRRLRDALAWSPRFDLNSGLRDTVAWHRRQAELHGAVK